MAHQGKRVWKLQENVAHSALVKCLALGPSSGRVMVTGGEDRKVNMWAVGKPNVIMSLSGHTTPVESVQFNNSEDLVLAGSQSGTLKIWDLEAAKILRTLTGHKSAIKCLDFHPYGEFVASGSSDTNLKLWDVRRKGCIFTYKGHADTVNHLRFSPDGRWIISAGQDGVAKLWDLTAGKILNDFTQHSAPVNMIEFHPKEFLLATCSADRTVKFWDLETFDLVSSSDVEQSSVRCISFHPEGHCLFSGSQDSLRIYGWEPPVCYDTYSLGWGKVADVAFSSNQMIGASFSQMNIAVWVVELSNLDALISKTDEEQGTLKKDAESQEAKAASNAENVTAETTTRKSSLHRKSFNTRPRTTSSKPRPAVKEQVPEDDDNNAGCEDISNYNEIFKPSAALRRSPTSERKAVEPFKAPDEQPTESEKVIKHEVITSDNPKHENSAQPPTTTDVNNAISKPQKANYAREHSDIEHDTQKHPVQGGLPPNVEISKREPAPFVPPPASVSISKEGHLVESPKNDIKSVSPSESAPSYSSQSSQQRREKVVVAPQGNPSVFNMNDFMPAAGKSEENFHGAERLDYDSTLGILRKSHQTICTIMGSRLKNLLVVGQMWNDGEIKTAVQTASSMSDQAVLVDLLNVLVLKQTLWNLDICMVVLAQIKHILNSKYESYVETACNVIRVILKNFAAVIKSNMAAPPVAMGCDIVREERYQRCKKCHSFLIDIKELAIKLSHSPGRHGSLNKQIVLALSVID